MTGRSLIPADTPFFRFVGVSGNWTERSNAIWESADGTSASAENIVMPVDDVRWCEKLLRATAKSVFTDPSLVSEETVDGCSVNAVAEEEGSARMWARYRYTR